MYKSRRCGVYGLLGSQNFPLSFFLLVALKIPSALALDVNSYRVKVKIKKKREINIRSQSLEMLLQFICG